MALLLLAQKYVRFWLSVYAHILWYKQAVCGYLRVSVCSRVYGKSDRKQ